MAQSFVFNPFTGKFDIVNTGVSIPEVTMDPSSPSAGDTWVLVAGAGLAGEGMGVLGLTYSGDVAHTTYQLSYFTLASTIVRTELS